MNNDWVTMSQCEWQMSAAALLEDNDAKDNWNADFKILPHASEMY